MTPQQYSLLAEGMRYVFLLLFIVMVIRTAKNAVIEFSHERKSLKNTRPAMYALCFEWEQFPSPRPLHRDNLIGSGNNCDIRIKSRSVKEHTIRIKCTFKDVYVERLCDYSYPINVNDIPLIDRKSLEDGDIIEFGTVRMKLFLPGKEPKRSYAADTVEPLDDYDDD